MSDTIDSVRTCMVEKGRESNKDAAILFLRYPEHGKMKMNFSGELGDDLAYDLQVCFIRDILNTLHSVDAETVIVGTGATGKGPRGIFGKSLRLVQRGHDTGERFHNAFADVFSHGYERAVLVGPDCPGLSTEYLRMAFSELDSHDAVLGPDREGGYCLIGLHERSLLHDLLRDISWGTSRVLMETIGNMENALVELSILEQLERVKSVEDLVRLADTGSASALNTLRFLEQHRDTLMGEL